MPLIDVDGVGRIAFPVLPVQAERLVAIAEAAPYGRSEETVVDREVRRTWQVDSSRVQIGGRHWEKTLGELLDAVALGLGVSGPIEADFYKLLVYDAGSFSSTTGTPRRSTACSRRWCWCCPRPMQAANWS